MPDLDLSNVEWAGLPIDRIEGKSDIDGWMPDTPTIHSIECKDIDVHYCWPTKLTFAPLLSDRLLEKIGEPSQSTSDYSLLPAADYTQTPWDKADWIKDD